FFDAVALDPMLDRGGNERYPGIHILRRAAVRLPPEQRLCLSGEFARHEAEFDEGPSPVVEDHVEDLVDVREGVHRRLERSRRPEPTPIGCPVDEHVVVEDAMEADVTCAERVDGLAEMTLPVGTQGFVRTPRAHAL